MSKRRHQRTKRTAPDLSRTDRILYTVLQVLCMPLVALPFLALSWLIEADLGPDVLAREWLWSVVLAPLQMIFVAFSLILLTVMRVSKVPLCGRTDVTYAPPYNKGFRPLLRPIPNAKRRPREKALIKKYTTAYLSAFLCLLLLCGLGTNPRNEITSDGTITQRNSFNQPSRVWERSDIASVQIYTRQDITTVRRRGSIRLRQYPAFGVRLTTRDGKSFDFSMANTVSGFDTSIADELYALTRIKARFDPSIVTYEIDEKAGLDRIADYYGYDGEDEAALYGLFGLPMP